MHFLSYFTRFTWRGRMPAAEILGWKRSKHWKPILHNSKCSETPRDTVSENIKSIWQKRFTRGATTCPRGWGHAPLSRRAPCLVGHPMAPWCPSSPIWDVLTWKKSKGGFRNQTPPSRGRTLAETNLGLRLSCSAGDTSLREGESVTAVINNNSPILGRVIFINIFTSTISSQTLVHLLYPIFVSKPQIGTCGLLVVLITPCSWC